MIKSLNTFTAWTKTIITTIVGVLSGFFMKNTIYGVDATLMLIAVIIILILISKLIEFLLHEVINRSLFVRKLLLGSHFIEGFWLQKFVNIYEDKKIERVTLTKISFRGNGYAINGETFNFDCESRGVFHSKYSEYQDYCLKYAFEGLTSSIEEKQIGNNEFKFVQTEKFPKKAVGGITNNIQNNSLRVFAYKLSADDAIKIAEEDTKLEVIERFIKKRCVEKIEHKCSSLFSVGDNTHPELYSALPYHWQST